MGFHGTDGEDVPIVDRNTVDRLCAGSEAALIDPDLKRALRSGGHDVELHGRIFTDGRDMAHESARHRI